jgi:hypothetical protein
MPYGEVEGGIVRRYWCNNPRCGEPWHYSSWCPTTGSSIEDDPPLSGEQLLERAARQRELQRLRAADEAEEARRHPPVREPVAPEPPGYGWVLVLVPVMLVVGAAMLMLVLH